MQILIVILIFTFWFWLKFRLEVLLVTDHLSKVKQLCVPASIIINVWNLSFKIFIEIRKLMILWINFPKSPNFEDLWFDNRTSKLLSDLPWSQFLGQTTVTSRGASSILKTKESSQSRITRQENLKEIRDNSSEESPKVCTVPCKKLHESWLISCSKEHWWWCSSKISPF